MTTRLRHTRPCRWREDEDGTWTASCGVGRMWEFIEGGPAENRVAFCLFCGDAIKAVPFEKKPEAQRCLVPYTATVDIRIHRDGDGGDVLTPKWRRDQEVQR